MAKKNKAGKKKLSQNLSASELERLDAIAETLPDEETHVELPSYDDADTFIDEITGPPPAEIQSDSSNDTVHNQTRQETPALNELSELGMLAVGQHIQQSEEQEEQQVLTQEDLQQILLDNALRQTQAIEAVAIQLNQFLERLGKNFQAIIILAKAAMGQR